PLDQLELGFEEVDMLLLAGEDGFEQFATDEIADILAMDDGAAQLLDRLALEVEVGAQDLLDRLADPKAAEHLEIGKALEEQDSVGQPVGMLHLVDRFVPLIIGEPLHAPIGEHPVVEPILVDRGQLVLERLVEVLDYLIVALHRGLLLWPRFYASRAGKDIKKWRKTAEN